MRTAFFLLAATTAGCSTQKSPDWVTHKDPRGFSVQVPGGWRVASDSQSGRVSILGPERQQVIVWPVFIPGTLDEASAPAVLRKLATGAGVKPGWRDAASVGKSAVRLAGSTGDSAAVAALTWSASAKGTAGYVFIAQAPPAAYRRSEPDFARILASFRAAGAPASGGSPSLEYTRWTDPRENAFSLETPRGWQVSGGLFRFASVDVRGAWEVVSPSGIRITGGDADLPTFTEPIQTLGMAGFPEGSWYSPGYGVRMFVRRYFPGMQFAREYVITKAARGCADVEITENRERPDAVSSISSAYGQYGIGLSLTAGEAAFTCRKDGRPMAGYHFAGTRRTQMPGMPGGLWNAEYLFGYLAPQSEAQLAQSVLDHILRSIQLNPQWVAAQQNITAATSQIVSRTHNEISRTISSSYWSRQQVMDELSRRRSNAILGVEDVIDPVSGRQIKVESGSNYFWMDQRGAIVGTDTDTRPNLDFRELIRLP